MKKGMSFLLAVLMILSLTGCGGTPANSGGSGGNASAPSAGNTSGAIEAGATVLRTTEDWPTYYDLIGRAHV